MLHIHVMYMSRSNLDILLIFRSSVLDFKNTFYSRKKCNKNCRIAEYVTTFAPFVTGLQINDPYLSTPLQIPAP